MKVFERKYIETLIFTTLAIFNGIALFERDSVAAPGDDTCAGSRIEPSTPIFLVSQFEMGLPFFKVTTGDDPLLLQKNRPQIVFLW